MNEFIFTDWRNAVLSEGGEISTSMYGERPTEYGDEMLYINIRMKDSEPSRVLFRHLLESEIISEETRCYTNTMEIVKDVKKYIEGKRVNKQI